MLGLHNILLIAPPPSSFSQQQPPPISTLNDHCNINPNTQDSWVTLKKYQQQTNFPKKDALQVVDQDSNISTRVCRDCGNRAKKECEHRRCRTCCKARGYDCATHVKSTWVPAARRRERHVGAGGGSSGSSAGGGGGAKRPRENVTTNCNSFTSNNNNGTNAMFDTSSSHQDANFKQSLPGQVCAPAIFRCIRVTTINGGESEVAYQAMVNISGHVFKGFLYDQGIDEKNLFPSKNPPLDAPVVSGNQSLS